MALMLGVSLVSVMQAGGAGGVSSRLMVFAGDSGINGNATLSATGSFGMGYPGYVQVGGGGQSLAQIETALYAHNKPYDPTFIWDMGLDASQYTDVQEVLDTIDRIMAWLKGWKLMASPTRRANMSSQELADALTIDAHISSEYPDAYYDWRTRLLVSDSSPEADASIALGQVPEYLLKEDPAGTHIFQAQKLEIESDVIEAAIADGATDRYLSTGNLFNFADAVLDGGDIAYVGGKIVVSAGSGTRTATWTVNAPPGDFDCRVIVESRSAGNVNRRFLNGLVNGTAVTANGDTTQRLTALGNTTYQLTFAAVSVLTIADASVKRNLVENGSMDAAGPPPTAGTGWSVGSGVATATAGSASSLTWSQTTVATKSYLIEWDIITSNGSTGVRPTLTTGGTSVLGTYVSTVGHHSQLLVSNGNSNASLAKPAAWAGSVDNFTIAEILP